MARVVLAEKSLWGFAWVRTALSSWYECVLLFLGLRYDRIALALVRVTISDEMSCSLLTLHVRPSRRRACT